MKHVTWFIKVNSEGVLGKFCGISKWRSSVKKQVVAILILSKMADGVYTVSGSWALVSKESLP